MNISSSTNKQNHENIHFFLINILSLSNFKILFKNHQILSIHFKTIYINKTKQNNVCIYMTVYVFYICCIDTILDDIPTALH